MKSRSLRRAGALLLALALACSLLTLPAAAADVDSITLQPSSLSLEVGASAPLTVNTEPAGESVTWISSNSSVATVSGGTVTAVSEGSATIIAMAGNNGKSAVCNVTVTAVKVPADSVSLDTAYLGLLTGETARLTATVLPSNATDKTVSFSSSDESVATVTPYGLLTAVGAGTATITATADGKTAFCVVQVTARPAVTGVRLDKTSLNLPQEGSDTLTATVEGGTADKSVTWSSSNSALVGVTQRGRVTVSSRATVGTSVTITARSNADPTQDAICIVTVIEPQPPEVNRVEIISPSTDAYRYLDVGETLTLQAQAEPASAPEADRRINWSSSDPSIATVDSNGVVKGVATGAVTITASAEGGGTSDFREIEVSGIKLSYLKRSPSGGRGETVELNENSIESIYQYRDISVAVQAFGSARNNIINWESSNTTVASVVSGRVTANYPGEATITANVANESYTASFKVRVSEDVADAIEVNMGANPTYSFSGLLSQLNSRSQSKAGAPLDSVYSLKVSTENGVLYYKYNSPSNPGHGVGGTERYYYQASGQGQMALRDVTFVPSVGFSGTAVVNYNAEATSGATFTGTIRIKAAASNDIAYSTEMDQPVALEADHFSAICKGRNGQALRYVTFRQPDAGRGALYYNYSPGGQFSPKVDSSTRYYASSQPSVNNITFVPAEGYTGSVSIPYQCVDSAGTPYSGTVTVTVYGLNGGGSGSSSSSGTGRDVEYSTALNQRRDLNRGDFNDASQRATGYDLDYIRFDSLPSSSQGVLYLDYDGSSTTRVVTGRSYYRSSAPRISDISFIPARNYSGTVTIPFIGANTGGATFSGNLIIRVADGTSTVRYSTSRNQAVTFGAGDFNNACRSATGTTLNYIRFNSLPSSSAGILYYDYVNANSTGSRAATGTDYRRSGSPSISNLTFVPASGYTGTVSIPFTGYDDDGDRFTGSVSIAVGGGQIISYSATANRSVRFSGSDFNNACRSATGNTLSYVRFNTVSTSYGTLYEQYNTSSRTGSSVSTNTNYYYSGGTPLISDVSFAASSSSGAASIGYTGYSTQGDSFSGTVEIRVTGAASSSGSSTASASIRYTGSSTPIRFRSSDFQSAVQNALGTTLSYVQFASLPGAGHLYQNYASPSQTGTGVTTSTHCTLQQLDQIAYMPQAEYQGTVTIPYTAYDAQGNSCSGAVEISLANSYCSTPFTDLASGWDWARPSIEFLRQGGITNGYRDGTFRPGQSISRGEFTLMVCRAFQFSSSNSSSFPDVPADSIYASAVAAAKELGVVQGNNGLFQPSRPISRQSAMTMICRALEAAGQPVPAADLSVLSSYADGSQVSTFARSSVASLIQMGAVHGNSSMRLNPTASISRAEMAVILHRVLAR